MVVCVDESRSRSNALAVFKAVEAVIKEVHRDSLLARVKKCLRDSSTWPWKVEEKFPVVAEIKGLGQVEAMMRRLLIEGLNEALGLGKPKVSERQ